MVQGGAVLRADVVICVSVVEFVSDLQSHPMEQYGKECSTV